MPATTYAAVVDAPLERVWALLQDKVERPERYIDGVEGVKIVERDGDTIHRRMRLGAREVEERIEINTQGLSITFTLVNDPHYEGSVVNAIVPPGAPEISERCSVIFTLDWVEKPDGAEPVPPEDAPDMGAAIHGAVEQLKQLAEAGAQSQATPGQSG